MSNSNPICPKCNSSYSYFDQRIWICPECSHEWLLDQPNTDLSTKPLEYRDANGVVLTSGDTVRVVKDLKVAGSKLKSGTKIKGIKILDEPVDDHEILCRVEGFGTIYLKCSVVKKEL